MRRFTDEQQVMPMPVAENAGYYILCAIKLAAYEDTGLSPEEVALLAKGKTNGTAKHGFARIKHRSCRTESAMKLIESTFSNKAMV